MAGGDGGGRWHRGRGAAGRAGPPPFRPQKIAHPLGAGMPFRERPAISVLDAPISPPLDIV